MYFLFLYPQKWGDYVELKVIHSLPFIRYSKFVRVKSMWITLLQVFFFLGLLANAVLFIPQAIRLYRYKSSREISILTFLGFNIIQILTTIHALIEKDWLLFIGSILAFITCASVTYLSLLYRFKRHSRSI